MHDLKHSIHWQPAMATTVSVSLTKRKQTK